jgi:tetraacyldisaccharide 4'-kinase
LKAPDFWWREPGLAAQALAPLSRLYGAIAAHRMARPGVRAAVPVICVGNVTVGGAGKTPTALALAAMLAEMGRRPFVLMRGYGGRLPGPVRVEPERHGPADVGDEALLLARAAPTIVSRDRPTGAALAVAQGADVILMDDGLQNPSLAKDLTLAVFDGAVGVGNGLCLPAGPLRAPLAAQWPRIDAAIVIGNGAPGDAVAAQAGLSVPVFRAALRPGSLGSRQRSRASLSSPSRGSVVRQNSSRPCAAAARCSPRPAPSPTTTRSRPPRSAPCSTSPSGRGCAP